MKIACLGWGSLIWEPKNLLISEQWYSNGPILPVEFSRQSADGRLTLVIDSESKPIPVLWSLMTTSDIAVAKESLRHRENIPDKLLHNYIGALTSEETSDNDSVRNSISGWLREMKLDAAIWTNLPCKFDGVNGIKPTKDEAIAYLKNLGGDAIELAKIYIQKAPTQIMTDYRVAFEQELGWKP